MQSEEVGFQSAFEPGQRLGCPQDGHSTIVGPEQRAVVNEQCRCDKRGVPDIQS